jgi:hypothetical protein
MSRQENLAPAAKVSTSLVRVCRWGQAIALIAMVSILAWLGYAALHADAIVAQAMVGLPAPELPPSTLADIAGKLIFVAPALLFILALWRMWQVFSLVKTGAYLTPRAQFILVQLGWLALLGGVLGIIARTVGIALLTSGNPPGRKVFSILISSGDISSLIMGLMFFIFALLLREMASVAEDNRSII